MVWSVSTIIISEGLFRVLVHKLFFEKVVLMFRAEPSVCRFLA